MNVSEWTKNAPLVSVQVDKEQKRIEKDVVIEKIQQNTMIKEKIRVDETTNTQRKIPTAIPPQNLNLPSTVPPSEPPTGDVEKSKEGKTKSKPSLKSRLKGNVLFRFK